MPHRSGGGHSSHSSHRSSHSSHRSSSRRSSHHSYSSGGSNYSETRISTEYFEGSKKYGYTDKSGTHYVYSDSDLVQRNFVFKLFSAVFFFVFGFPCIIQCLFVITTILVTLLSASIPVNKLEGAPADYCIIDSAYVIDNKIELEDSLEKFYYKTGIPVCIKTIDYSASNRYKIDDIAYDYYVENIPDEKHLVIVYSEDNTQYNWDWGAVQGDETDDILTNTKFNKIEDSINQKRRNSDDIGKCLEETFDESLEYIMEPNGEKLDFEFFSTNIFPFLFSLIPFILISKILKKFKKTYFLASDESGQITIESPQTQQTLVAPSTGTVESFSPKLSNPKSNDNIIQPGLDKDPEYDNEYGVPNDML